MWQRGCYYHVLLLGMFLVNDSQIINTFHNGT